jgi:hypothetical protein
LKQFFFPISGAYIAMQSTRVSVGRSDTACQTGVSEENIALQQQFDKRQARMTDSFVYLCLISVERESVPGKNNPALAPGSRARIVDVQETAHSPRL